MDFSVIIPVYNCKAFLPACVESICRGLPASSELLLIDDGSTDGSGALCDVLGLRYASIRVFHQENRGASAARNCGLRQARGTYILFADADDTVSSWNLFKLLEQVRNRKEALTAFGASFDYYYRGSCYRSDSFLPRRQERMDREAWQAALFSLYREELLSPLWNKVFRRDILTKHVLFLREDMTVYEDLEFVLRYLNLCDDIFCVPLQVYHYRQSEDEGNAGRRLRRMESLWDGIAPVKAVLEGLPGGEQLVHRLYLVLAREKIAVSDRTEIRQVCREYGQRFPNGALPSGTDSRFVRRLRMQRVAALQWSAAFTALRHRLAVRLKVYGKRRERP